MRIILQKDVKDLGKVGDIVKVSNGYARNFLFPRKLAIVASEGRVKEFEHLQRVAEVKRKKAVAERKSVLDKINGQSVHFSVQAGDTDKIFGSVTTMDISNELEQLGFSIDKKDIYLEEPIIMLGQHKAFIKMGDGLEAEIVVIVDRVGAKGN